MKLDYVKLLISVIVGIAIGYIVSERVSGKNTEFVLPSNGIVLGGYLMPLEYGVSVVSISERFDSNLYEIAIDACETNLEWEVSYAFDATNADDGWRPVIDGDQVIFTILEFGAGADRVMDPIRHSVSYVGEGESDCSLQELLELVSSGSIVVSSFPLN